jgi:hypothetical protein
MRVDIGSQFNIEVFDQESNLTIMSTVNQTILMMKHYKQIGFTVKAQKIMGLGERDASLLLGTG